MKKLELFEETLGLFAQEMALKYGGSDRPEEKLSRMASLIQEIKCGQEKKSGNHTTSLNSRNDTGSSSISSIKAGKDSKEIEGGKNSKDPSEEIKKSAEEKIIIRSKPLNLSSYRMFFAKSPSDLKNLNSQLSEISEKFSDFKTHQGYFFAENQGRRMFELSDMQNLDQYVLLNCFVAYLVSSQVGENLSSFGRFVNRLKGLESAASKQGVGFGVFMEKFSEVVIKLDREGLASGVDSLIDACIYMPNFLNVLMWSFKTIIGDFLNDLKQAKRNSYLQKYYLIDYLLFGIGSIKEEDNSLYKMMRYCVEVFFISVDGFCELIYIRKADQEYHYKNIFINKPKDLQQKKPVLLYLLVIDEKYSLFSSFEIPEPTFAVRLQSMTDPSTLKLPIEQEINRGSIDNSIPEEGQTQPIVVGSPGLVDRDGNPSQTVENRLQPIQISTRPLDIPQEFSKSELSPIRPQPNFRSIYKTELADSSNNLPQFKGQLSEQPSMTSIYRQQPSMRSENQITASPPKEQPKAKLLSIRQGSESLSFFDRENAVIGLMTCLEEMDANFLKLASQRVNPPKNDIFSRGRSYGREASQNHTKVTRVAGRSQDVAFNHRYTSGTRLNLFSGGLSNGLSNNISLKQDRNNLLGRDQLFRGLDYKFTSSISGPPSSSYRYPNYTESALGGNFRRVTTSDQPTYLIN